jgi:hypothetical protein
LKLLLRLCHHRRQLPRQHVVSTLNDPSPGVEYTVLAMPQPSQAAGKMVEVIELFIYHCSCCHALQPVLPQ